MITKTIHYCSFGTPPRSHLLDLCRESWIRYCPDYEIVEWNDETFAEFRNPFFDEAISRRKFAFASDYARAYVLNKFGGIYLDTDVELRKPLDHFLQHAAFTGFERVGFPFTALWGVARLDTRSHGWFANTIEMLRFQPSRTPASCHASS